MLLPAFLLLFLTLVAVLAKSEFQLHSSATRILFVLFYLSALVSIVSVYLFSKEIYFISDFLNKTVIWYPIFFAGVILGTNKKLTNWIHKLSLYAFIFVAFMITIVTFIPFVGLNLNAYLISKPGKIYHNSKSFIVQESYNGILSKPYPPDIYRKKYGIFVIPETSRLPCEANRDVHVTVRGREGYFEIIYTNPDGTINCTTELPKN